MQLTDFERLLDTATASAIAFARTMILDTLPNSYIYRVFPNQSHDENRRPDVVVYPEDSLPSLNDYIEMTREQCLIFLYRNGRIPEWVDLSVGYADAMLTYVNCHCCGRFTDDDQRLYYNHRQLGPFGVKSPIFPKSIPFGDKNPKFWISEMPSYKHD